MQASLKAHLGLLLVGFATFIAMGAGQALQGSALPVWARSLGLAPASTGWLVTVHWIGCAGGVVAAFLRPHRITPRLAVAAMAAGAGLIALAPTWPVVLIGAMIFGFGYGCGAAVLNPRVLHAFGPRGPAMNSLLNAVFSIGAIGAPLAFVALGANTMAGFLIVAAICAAIWWPAGDGDTSGTMGQAGTAVPLRLHAGVLAFQSVAIGLEASLIGLGPAALIRAGLSEARAAEMLSLFFVAFLAVRLVLVLVMRHLSSFTVMALALALATLAGLGASFLSPGPFYVLTGFAAGAFFPSGYVTAVAKMGVGPRVTPVVIGAGLVGAILSPIVLTSLAAGMGPRGLFQLIALVAGTAAVAAAFARPRMNRP